jgi:transcriptional regulator with XRE-family HTH domain
MVSSNIKFLRNYSGLSQPAFGKIFNVSRGMIDSYERELANPSTKLIVKIAEHYKMSVDDITKRDLRTDSEIIFGKENENLESPNLVSIELLQSKDDLIIVLKTEVEYLRGLYNKCLENQDARK